MTALGAEESSYRSKGKDNRAHSHGEAGAGAHPPVSLPGHAPLCLSDAEQAAPHPGWVVGHWKPSMENLLISSVFDVLNRYFLYFCVYYRLCVRWPFLHNLCLCTFLYMSIQAPCVFVCVCECRLCERRGDVHSFVSAGSLFRGGCADLYRGNNPGPGAPAQGGCLSFQRCNLHTSFIDFWTIEGRRQTRGAYRDSAVSSPLWYCFFLTCWKAVSYLHKLQFTHSNIIIPLESCSFPPD